MKLSNKILIGFFAFIFLYLTAAFAELRLTGTTESWDSKNTVSKTVDLKGINHVVAKNIDFEIVGSPKAELEIKALQKEMLSSVSYTISGDTLLLSSAGLEEVKRVRLTVEMPENIRSLSLDHSIAAIKGLEADQLNILQVSGRMWMSDCDIKKIEVNASKQSHLQINTTQLDTLKAEMAESQIYVFAHTKFFEGSIEKQSFIQLQNADAIRFRKDESSKLSIFE